MTAKPEALLAKPFYTEAKVAEGAGEDRPLRPVRQLMDFGFEPGRAKPLHGYSGRRLDRLRSCDRGPYDPVADHGVRREALRR
jgi:hypothetical protein